MSKNDSIKRYNLSANDKLHRLRIVFSNPVHGNTVVDYLKDTKYDIINNFISKMVSVNQVQHNKNQDFMFILDLKPQEENELKEYLIKHKDFIIQYLKSNKYFPDSHIFQLYLQYIPDELTEEEKNIFLDAYINMANSYGIKVADKDKKKLEYTLNMNQ